MKGVKLGETILLLPTKGYTAHSTALEALSYGEVWAGRNVPGLSRPCRHRRVGIATRGRESKRCIGAILGAGNMRIPMVVLMVVLMVVRPQIIPPAIPPAYGLLEKAQWKIGSRAAHPVQRRGEVSTHVVPPNCVGACPK